MDKVKESKNCGVLRQFLLLFDAPILGAPRKFLIGGCWLCATGHRGCLIRDAQ